MVSEPILVVAKLARVFDSLGISYVVGGSLASSAYGTPRSTLDVDVIADISLSQTASVAQSLTKEFHVDAEMIREAVQQRSSFNAVYLATMFKADVFIAGGDAWSREELSRGQIQQFETSDGLVRIRFASLEDTLLHKLGNEVSDRQWSDVLGMLRIQAGTLDHAYLDRWVPHLGVADLLDRARRA